MLEPLRQLVDVEEAGAADDVLLQGVVHTLVLLLQHSGHGTRVTVHLYCPGTCERCTQDKGPDFYSLNYLSSRGDGW